MTPVTPQVVPRARAGTYAGLFFVTLATLMYEIGLTRIFSVTTFYHFAFVAISLALFGLTAGALLVHLRPTWFRAENVKRDLALAAVAFAIAIPVCLAIQLSIRMEARWSLDGAASVIGTCLIASVPFVLSGIVVCLCLTRFPDRVNRLYAVDLLGAGLGCVLLAVLFASVDGPSALIATGALAGVGGVCFALDAGGHRLIAGLLAVTLVLGAFAAFNAARAEDGRAPVAIVWTKEARDAPHLSEEWNSFSRVTVDGDPSLLQQPFGWGLSPTTPDVRVAQLDIALDSIAGTTLTKFDGDLLSTDFLRYDVTNLAHHLRPNAKVLVVGVGGGRDILSAIEFEQPSVTGVEINGNVLDLLRDRFADFTGHLDDRDDVRLVNDEARSYLARTDERFDILQISLIDTFAATTAGAFALSENSLYTTEAWSTFLDRLTPDGILTVSRWYDIGGLAPLETYRTVALATQALRDRGVEHPRDHILVFRSPPIKPFTVANVMVSPEPYSAADLARITAVTERLGFEPVLTPETAERPVWAALAADDGPQRGLDMIDEDVSPPTDDRPFFFQMADLDNLLEGRGLDDPRVTRPVRTLGFLALAVLLLTIVFLGIPMLLARRRASNRGMVPFYVYFAGIGLGFLLVEFSQVLRLSVYLGHPVYSLTVVLFSMLVFSGIGSMLTERFVDPSRRPTLLAPMAALLGVLVIFGLVTTLVIEATESASTPVRIAVSVALLAPIGLVMGMPLTIGMRTASEHADAPTALLWGVNGASSVCASVFAMVIALFFGITVAFWTGWVAYALAGAAIVVATRRRAGAPPRTPEVATADELRSPAAATSR